MGALVHMCTRGNIDWQVATELVKRARHCKGWDLMDECYELLGLCVTKIPGDQERALPSHIVRLFNCVEYLGCACVVATVAADWHAFRVLACVFYEHSMDFQRPRNLDVALAPMKAMFTLAMCRAIEGRRLKVPPVLAEILKRQQLFGLLSPDDMWIAAACVGGSPLLATFVHTTWPVDAVAFRDHQGVFEALVARGATEHAKVFWRQHRSVIAVRRNNDAPFKQAWQGGHLDTVKWLWHVAKAGRVYTRVSLTPPGQWYTRCLEARISGARTDVRFQYLQMLRWGVVASGHVCAWPAWVQQYIKEYRQHGVVSPGVVPTNGHPDALPMSMAVTSIPEEVEEEEEAAPEEVYGHDEYERDTSDACDAQWGEFNDGNREYSVHQTYRSHPSTRPSLFSTAVP